MMLVFDASSSVDICLSGERADLKLALIYLELTQNAIMTGGNTSGSECVALSPKRMNTLPDGRASAFCANGCTLPSKSSELCPKMNKNRSLFFSASLRLGGSALFFASLRLCGIFLLLALTAVAQIPQP